MKIFVENFWKNKLCDMKLQVLNPRLFLYEMSSCQAGDPDGSMPQVMSSGIKYNSVLLVLEANIFFDKGGNPLEV